MNRSRPLLLLLAFSASARAQDGSADASADAEALKLESAHYAFQAVGLPKPVAEEYLRLAEALHVHLASHFGAAPAPKSKLEIRFWEKREDYQAGGQADGIPLDSLSAGGIYWTGTKRAYFWRQPSPYATRHLFLHELTHQFQNLAVLDNDLRRVPGWYLEGIAEYFGWHRWDGTKLEPGRSDVLALEQRIPGVVEQAAKGEWDVLGYLSGKTPANYAQAWALVHFFLAGPDKALTARFKAQERKAWKGQKDALSAATLFGPRVAAYADLAVKYVREIRTTWKIEWINWDAIGEDIAGESNVVAIVRTRAACTEKAVVSALVAPTGGRIGLLVGFRSTNDFVALDVTADGQARLVRRVSGKWQVLGNATVPAAASFALRLEADPAGAVRGFVGDAQVLAATVEGDPAAGPVGLLVDGGRGRFSAISAPTVIAEKR